MLINLTNEQFKNLLQLTYLGNFMVNGVRSKNEAIEKFNDLENLLFSLAPNAGLPHFTTSLNKKHFPSSLFENDEELHGYIAHYDEVTFMDLLDESMECMDELDDDEIEFLNQLGLKREENID